MAPLTRGRKAAAVASADPVMDPADRLSSLPESILVEILSFLPDQEAVRTCVLARAWRHVWKFTTHLLITGDSVQEVREFVDRLLRARLAALVDGLSGGGGGGPLDVCEIRFGWFKDEDMPIVNRWIRLAVACRVQGFDIAMWRDNDGDSYFRISNMILVSQHLTSLKLSGVWFSCEYLDFSGCPALEHLEIRDSNMTGVRKMTSPSVTRLVITEIECSQGYRFRICFPHLVSLRLEGICDRYPVLESMPELEVASVKVDAYYVDFCTCKNRVACEHVMGDIHSSDSDTEEESDDCGGQNTTKCMLLEGLSQARDLELRACQRTYIFRRDLRWCPTFSNLKTLLLNDFWCEPGDCRTLVCILEHAPVLEELTVIFTQQQGWSKYNVKFEGYLDATVESNMMPRCLKIVNVKCRKVDETVLSVLHYLQTLNIRFHSRIAKG